MIFFKSEFIDVSNAEFKALDGDLCLGSCKLYFGCEPADIYEMNIEPYDLSIGEGLIRAAFNFAANKGKYMGKCTAQNSHDIAKTMNFEFINGEYINDIPSILMGSCCKFDK